MDLVVGQYIRTLDSIFVDAKKIDKEDCELRSHMSKYLCIRVSGLMETFFKRQIANYLDKSTPKPIGNYVNSRFQTFTSVNSKKIKDTLGLFSKEWIENFEYLVSEKLQASLDSIVSNRHNLAHGKNPGITLNQVDEYYNDIKEIISALEMIIAK